MEALNSNIIVRPLLENRLGNGLSITENRGRRDIIRGEVILSAVDKHYATVGDIVWFPLYAADQIILNGEEALVLKYADLILREGVNETL